MAVISIKNKTKSGSLLVGNAFYNPVVSVDYLVVAGGGGAGAGNNFQIGVNGGGGGAGGLRSTVTATGGGGTLESAAVLSLGTSYTITIGAGGAGGVAAGNMHGVAGNNSVFSTITSTGGGRGGNPDDAQGPATSGGSGGGAGGHPFVGSATGGAGTANQGYAGGSVSGNDGSHSASAPCGGAGGAGGNRVSSTAGGVGGAGLNVSITGTSIRYALGGATDSTANGGVNKGDGGATDVGDYTRDGNPGGSGVVILSALQAAVSTTGSPTATTSGAYYIYQFTGSGTITY